MKDLKQHLWCALAGASAGVWGQLISYIDGWNALWIIPLAVPSLIGMVVGFHRGFPDGIWGIK